MESKDVIRARIEELEWVTNMSSYMDSEDQDEICKKIKQLRLKLEIASDSMMDMVLESHKAVCEAKQMGMKEAFGHQPVVFYSLALGAESGELQNEVVKAIRDGYDDDRLLNAVKKELPDVLVYAYLLAFVLDIDLTHLVNEKLKIVVERAKSGYYGGPLKRDHQ